MASPKPVCANPPRPSSGQGAGRPLRGSADSRPGVRGACDGGSRRARRCVVGFETLRILQFRNRRDWGSHATGRACVVLGARPLRCWGRPILATFRRSISANRNQLVSANAPADDCPAYTPLGCTPLAFAACGTSSTERASGSRPRKPAPSLPSPPMSSMRPSDTLRRAAPLVRGRGPRAEAAHLQMRALLRSR